MCSIFYFRGGQMSGYLTNQELCGLRGVTIKTSASLSLRHVLTDTLDDIWHRDAIGCLSQILFDDIERDRKHNNGGLMPAVIAPFSTMVLRMRITCRSATRYRSGSLGCFVKRHRNGCKGSRPEGLAGRRGALTSHPPRRPALSQRHCSTPSLHR